MKILLSIVLFVSTLITYSQIPTYKWVSGSQETVTPSIFRTTEPGARFGHFTFTDANGDLWLFGGQSQDIFELTGFYNDVWKYEKSSQTWNWITGEETVDIPVPEGNNSLSFDGIDDHVMFQNSPLDYSVNDNNGFDQTIEMWIKPTADGPIISWGNTTGDPGTDFQFVIQIEEDGQEIQVVTFGGLENLVEDLDLLDSWHHLAVVTNKRDNLSSQSFLKVYLDGQIIIDEESSIATFFSDNDNFGYSLGTKIEDGVSSYYTGQIDELRFWNVARNQGEILTNLYNEVMPYGGVKENGEGYSREGLVSYFPFNQGVANGTANKEIILSIGGENPTETYGWLNNFNRPEIFIGEMAEVRIWDSSKTGQEIVDLANTTVIGTEPGLVAAYDFAGATPNGDNTAITALEDLTANDRDGNFVNFDLDGVGSNFNASTLSILPTQYPNTDGGGNAMILADMNDDGFDDIVSSFSDDESISILINDQLGGFSGPTSFDVGSDPEGLTAGLFNNDAFPDIAVTAWGANPSDERVRIFFGDGAGGFTSNTDITSLIGAQPRHIRTADLNGDTNQDLIISNESYLAIRLGDGLGNFAAAGEYTIDGEIDGLAIDDFSNDGHLDIAYSGENEFQNRVLRTLVNDGLGSFSTVESDFNVGNTLKSIDLNNDGNQDLVSIDQRLLQTALGNGDGSFDFGSFSNFYADAAAVTLSAITIADTNGDNIDDVIASGPTVDPQDVFGEVLDILAIYHGDGQGEFTYSTSINIVPNSSGIKMADLDQNGELDIVISHAAETSVLLRETSDLQRLTTVSTMNFDGDDDRIEMPDVRNFNADFTWEGWVKTEDDGPLFSFTQADGESGFNGFIFYVKDGKLSIGSVFYNHFTTTERPSISDNQWHHIALTVTQPDEVKLYVDGVHMEIDYPIANELDFSTARFDASLDATLTARLGYANSDAQFLNFQNLTQPPQSNWTDGFPIPEDQPQAGRGFGASWTDVDGKFNIFGGQGIDGIFNSIRQFDPATKQWTVIKGLDDPSNPGSYGTIRVSDPANLPPARFITSAATDASNNVWVFGGAATTDPIQWLNDLWKYDPLTNEWVWVSGSENLDAMPTYGTMGVSDAANVPGARENHRIWVDSNDDLWLFGGYGVDSEGTVGHLNDLWKFDIISFEWTWISGDDLANQGAVLGALGESSASFRPGGRAAANQWVDSDGIVWIFGGQGYDKFGISSEYLNDLWSYNPTTNEWTWESGSDFANSTGSYNEKGLSSDQYVPGARWQSNGWIDGENTLWMYGGNFPNQISTGNYSDFWKYETSSGEWTWISGYNATVNADQFGLYGSFDDGLSPHPGARIGALRWTDQDGNFWMQGGSLQTKSDFGFFNDLWKYDTEKEFWAYLGGNTKLDFNDGVYGSKGVGNALNEPKNRWHGASWTGEDGKLWFFGGIHHNQAINGVAWLNDLWFYDPEAKVYTWMAGSSELNASGVYGQKGQGSTAHIPTARSSAAYWSDGEGNFYLFGGYGGFQYNNDIWKFNSNTLEWTWISGNNFQNTPGSYGEQGVSSSNNVIGARRYMNAMRDQDGIVWVFGGQGYDSEAQFGYLNDLWKYDPSTNEWTWVTGPKVTDQPGNFGTKGVASSDNIPPSRYAYESWIDDAGDIWIMGGVGVLKGTDDDFAAYLNDLWKFDTKTNLWTWVGGSDTDVATAEFGTQGEFSESNVIDRRWRFQNFGTHDKSIWLFGGNKGTDYSTGPGISNTYSDFWEIKFTPGLSRIETPTAIEQTAFTFSYEEAWARIFQTQVALSDDFSDVFYDEAVEQKEVSIPSLTPGTNYYYRVNATNEIGESGFTDFEQVLTLPATPEFASLELAVSDLTPTTMNLDWSTTSGVLDGYFIDISRDPLFTDASMAHADFNAKSIAVVQTQAVEDLNPGTKYYARLQSTNASGVSPYSAVVPFLTKPATPTFGAALVVSNQTQTSVELLWNEVPEILTNYNLTVSTLDDSFADGSAFLSDYDGLNIPKINTSLTVSNLDPGTEYFAFLTAENDSGESGQSDKITLLTTPSSPVFDLEGAIVSVGQTEATFSWEAPAGLYDGYLLEVSTDFSFANTNLMLDGYGKGGTPKSIAQSGLTEAVTELTPGQTYYARIRSYNSSGQSPNSNIISFTTIPRAPDFNTPSNISQTTASVNWSTSSGAELYLLDVNTASDFGTETAFFEKFPKAVTFEVLTNLSPGTQYYVRVQAVNGSGGSGDVDPSDFGEVDFLTKPMTPEFSSTALTGITQTSITINWEQVPEVLDGYRVDISTDDSFGAGSYLTGWENLEVAKDLTAILVDDLTPGAQYYARLRSYNATGASTFSEVISLITLPKVPTFDSDPISDISQSSATLSWMSVSGIFSGYYMELSTDASFADESQLVDGYGADNIIKAIDKGQSVEFIDELDAGTSYYSRLSAYNSAGASPWSDPVLVLTTPNTPVLNEISLIGQTSATVSWEAIAGAENYVIDISQNFFQTLVPAYNALPVDIASIDVVGLDPGEKYQIRVRSKNPSGESLNSELTELLTSPATPIARDATNSSTSVFTANWDQANGASFYVLEVSLDNFVTFHFNETLTTSNPIQMTNLQAGASYKYRVRAGNASGESPLSNEVTVIAQNNAQSLSIGTVGFDDSFTETMSTSTVSVALSGGLGTAFVHWRHRKVLSSTWSDLIEASGSGSSFSFDITDIMLDDVGVEFEVYATDSVTFVQNSGNKIKRAFTEAESAEIPSLVLSKWQMFSIPFVLDDDLVTSIFNELPLQDYKKAWRLMHYTAGVYQDGVGGFSTIELGKGYWFTATSDTQIKIGAGKANAEIPYKISLKEGWNQIGNPFTSPVDWTSVRNDNNAISTLDDLVIFNTENNDFESSFTLSPFSGAFVWANEAIDELEISPSTSSGRAGSTSPQAMVEGQNWLLPLTLNVGNRSKDIAGVGMNQDASATKDQFDRLVPPRFEDHLEMYTTNLEYFYPYFATDVVEIQEEHVWSFELSSNHVSGLATLDWDNTPFQGQVAGMWLVDERTGRVTEMTEQSTYSFNFSGQQSFSIHYSLDPDYKVLPGKLSLGDAYPNPAQGFTKIPVLLPKRDQPYDLELSVFDLQGRKISTIKKGSFEGGVYYFDWNLSDTPEIKNGIYLYKLTLDDPTIQPSYKKILIKKL